MLPKNNEQKSLGKKLDANEFAERERLQNCGKFREKFGNEMSNNK